MTLSKKTGTGHPPSELQLQKGKLNFALMQVCGMRTCFDHHIEDFLPVHLAEGLFHLLKDSETHLRKEIENGKAKK